MDANVLAEDARRPRTISDFELNQEFIGLTMTRVCFLRVFFLENTDSSRRREHVTPDLRKQYKDVIFLLNFFTEKP